MSNLSSNAASAFMEGLPDGTIHNPANAAHFMRVKPVTRLVRVIRNGAVLAESRNAVRVIEVGRDFYDPMIYLPHADASVDLVSNSTRTHCPLKGDAVYFDLPGDEPVTKIAWSYAKPFDFAAEIAGLIAFDPQHVIIEESPA